MKKDMSFEEAMEMLEAEVKKLESGSASLDETLASYENAIGLVKLCNEKIEGAERRVRVLVENADSTVTDKDFLVDTDET